MRPKQEIYLTKPRLSSPESLIRRAEFVKLHHPYAWASTHLDNGWTIELEREGDLEGVIWFSPLYAKIIECHAVIHPDGRGRWFSRGLLHTIYKTIVTETGCTACVAQIHDPKVGKLWEQIGFTVYPSFAILTIED